MTDDEFHKEHITRDDLMEMFESALYLMSCVKDDKDIQDFVQECKEDGFQIDPTETKRDDDDESL